MYLIKSMHLILNSEHALNRKCLRIEGGASRMCDTSRLSGVDPGFPLGGSISPNVC